ncbi:LLM class flavin-dependent oxidoreductase [Amycolatopsis pithecellobii]|uniref:LLM class flavin-dependent oxidoreductase n=1 Tax=Amycolatopsis pithecellobii TaxID=664692 RepID=A0A6N7Z0A7_9PSEU|nr:LLM class flavin-dependent oxidoreductase [Amycolatopsis pithecellobii]MTD53181.1 LLM class flavin-dependent oxidoreductase [Amycolatopsis pithecellobii]
MTDTTTTIAGLDIAVGSRERRRDEIVRIARAADEAGAGAIWVTESMGRDAFSILTELALTTSRIALGTGIVNVYSRTPTALAQAAASLLELMGTRTLNLGLGTSGRALVEGYHGVPYQRPVARLAETVRVLDTAFSTGKLPPDGTVFPLGGLPLGIDADRDRLRLYVAGLTPRTLEVTGAYADGWLPIWPSRSGRGGALRAVETAAEAAGRPRPAVAGYLYTVVGAEPGPLRATLAWYIAANGTAYRRLFESYGFGEQVERICGLWAAGDRDLARRAVTDEMLDDSTLRGAPTEVLRQAAAFRRAGVDRPVLRLPGQVSTGDCLRMITALAGTT